MPAGQKAEALARQHEGVPVGKVTTDGFAEKGSGNCIHLGGGAGTVLGRSGDGKHSVGGAIYGQTSLSEKNGSLGFSNSSLGTGLGYNYKGDQTSVSAGGHLQSLGKGASEVGGSMSMRHNLDNHNSLHGSASYSKTNGLGSSGKPNMGGEFGHTFRGEQTSLTTGIHGRSFDSGMKQTGGSMHVEHKLDNYNSLYGDASHSRTSAPGGFLQKDTHVEGGYKFQSSVNDSFLVGLFQNHSDSGPFGSNRDQGFNIGFQHRF